MSALKTFNKGLPIWGGTLLALFLVYYFKHGADAEFLEILFLAVLIMIASAALQFHTNSLATKEELIEATLSNLEKAISAAVFLLMCGICVFALVVMLIDATFISWAVMAIAGATAQGISVFGVVEEGIEIFFFELPQRTQNELQRSVG